MRALVLLSLSGIALVSVVTVAACADTTTMCQSGAKMGTQCYNSSLQTTYSSPPSSSPPPNNAPQPSGLSTTPQR